MEWVSDRKRHLESAEGANMMTLLKTQNVDSIYDSILLRAQCRTMRASQDHRLGAAYAYV